MNRLRCTLISSIKSDHLTDWLYIPAPPCSLNIFLACLGVLLLTVAQPALSTTPNEFHSNVERILISPHFAVNGVPVPEREGIPGITGSEEISEIAVALIKSGIGSRSDIDVKGVRQNDGNLGEDTSLAVIVLVSVWDIPSSKAGFRPQLMALHVRLIRPVLPPGGFYLFRRTFPVAMEISEDRGAFQESLTDALRNLLQDAVIMFYQGNP